MHYFKQYGAKRTGTNYLRALLEQNFSDIVVLMHTLGDKHGVPVNLEKYLREHETDPIGFTEAATAASPAANSLPFSDEQRVYMKTHANAIFEKSKNNELHYLISIKDPYAWIDSKFKTGMYHLHPADPEFDMKFCNLVKEQCLEYNRLYESWWKLSVRFPEQTIIIRYETLLSEYSIYLNDLQKLLQLKKLSEIYTDIENIAFPTTWDQKKSLRAVTGEIFDPEYYLQRKYLQLMRPEVLDCISEQIDWKLMALYGYEKINSTVWANS